VAAAAALVRERGVGATTLEDVVSASGVSKSQLYRHFEDKTALVRAVIELAGERTIARERERLQAVTTFAGLRQWRDAMVEGSALEQGRYGCALGSLANEVSDQDAVARRALDELFAVWHDLFEDLLRRFQREALLPQDADVGQLATGLLAAVQGGYLLAQTARDATAMASAIDMAIAHLHLLARHGCSAGRLPGRCGAARRRPLACRCTMVRRTWRRSVRAADLRPRDGGPGEGGLQQVLRIC
jgi:AcrR family transcriptional regulator